IARSYCFSMVSISEVSMSTPLPTIHVLDSISIPTNCTVPWDDMKGDGRTRFCNKCSEQVHDISEMTTAEALQLLNASSELPCLRILRRADGRVMTTDCPMTKRERIWKWLDKRSIWAASIFALIFLSGCENRPIRVTGDVCPLPSANIE